jgi:hypothetical protein
VERIRVKTRVIRNLYVLRVYAPGSRRKLLWRRASRRPWLPIERGEIVRVAGKTLRVRAVARGIERRGDVIEHVMELFTTTLPRRRGTKPAGPLADVVRMPAGDASMVTQFIRYHVFVRVYDGNPDAWLAHLREHGGDEGDVRFARWIRSRLRNDPALLTAIRKMVDATPFWSAAGA